MYNSLRLRVTNRVHMDCSERTTVLKERQRCARMTAIDLLSRNTGLFWPDLEHTSTRTHTHTSWVTGNKEPLCQVTEHREKNKGIEGCDMTNMRGFAGLWGNWLYSQGWLTLLICITHESGSQQRGAEQPHNEVWTHYLWNPQKKHTYTEGVGF